jgi:hypothetical protein
MGSRSYKLETSGGVMVDGGWWMVVMEGRVVTGDGRSSSSKWSTIDERQGACYYCTDSKYGVE